MKTLVSECVDCKTLNTQYEAWMEENTTIEKRTKQIVMKKTVKAFYFGANGNTIRATHG